VDADERLADYLAGELDADERTAFEAELARDAELRAQLAALRRADEALSHLSSPAPPAGFDERLDARLDRELDDLFGSRTAPADELAERRARRAIPRWVLATSGAAAALIVVAGVGIVAGGLGGLDGADDGLALDEPVSSLDAERGPVPEVGADMTLGLDAGPVIVAEDRAIEDEDVAGLLAVSGPLLLADAQLDPETAARLRPGYLDVLGVGETEAPAEAPDGADATDDADGAVAAERSDDAPQTFEAPAETALRTRGEVEPDDRRAVTRCLDVLMADSPTAIPVYAELAVRDDEPVVVLGLVDEDPSTGTFSRREIWVLSRADCQVRFFSQN
jgi:hypothetical protein